MTPRDYRYPTSIRLTRSLKLNLQEKAHERGHSLAQLITWILQSWTLAEDEKASANKDRVDHHDHQSS